MKSKIAERYIDNDTLEFRNGDRMVDASTAYMAIELTEQEAEERMQEKAIEAFKSSCLYQEGCLGAGMKCNPDKCEDLKAFIQKLKEDEVD